MHLISHELIHVFVSLVISVFVFWSFDCAQDKKWKLVIWVFAVGVFLDMDHLFDLITASGNLNDIFASSYFLRSNKVFVFLHSWELLVPWWIYIIWSRRYPLGWAVTLAFVGHLLVDQFSYGAYPLTYFLTYRWINNFQLDQLFSH